MLCHDKFTKFKANKYYSKSAEIHLGLIGGNVIDDNFV